MYFWEEMEEKRTSAVENAAAASAARGLGGHLGIAPAAPTRGTQHSSKVYWVKCACAFPIIASRYYDWRIQRRDDCLLIHNLLCNPKQL